MVIYEKNIFGSINIYDQYSLLKNNTVQIRVFFLNGAELPENLENLINHWSMNWAEFKNHVSYVCLDGLVVASCSLTQEVAG